MPQTRFVLSKALEMHLKIIVVVNKIDRPDARLDEIADEVLELLMDLDASEEQLENTPFLYCSGRAGTASFDPHAKQAPTSNPCSTPLCPMWIRRRAIRRHRCKC